MGELKLWKNEVDTYVARDAAHASELYEKLIGEPYRPDDLGVWVEDVRPQSDTLTIDLDTDEGEVTKTIAEWIATLPDGGMLCSTEW